MQLQPELAAEKRGVNSAHPRVLQIAATLGGGQRKFVAGFLQAFADRILDRGDFVLRKAFFPAAQRIDFFFNAFFAERGVRLRQAPQAGALNLIVVQIVIDKAAELAERLAGVRDQILVVDLNVIGRKLAAVGAPPMNHPFPIKRSRYQAIGLAAVPRQGSEPTHFFQRERNVTSVSDYVHK